MADSQDCLGGEDDALPVTPESIPEDAQVFPALPEEGGVLVARPIPPRKFCTRCGAPWDPAWVTCAVCATNSVAPALNAARPTRGQGSVVSSMALYFTLLGLSIVFLGMTIANEGDSGLLDNAVERLFAYDGIFSFVVLIWCLVCWRTIAGGLSRLGALRWYPLSVLLAIGTFVVAALAVYGLVTWLDLPDHTYSAPFLEAGYGWRMVLLSICVQPAIFEELAFRGVILGSLQNVLGVRDAVIVSALMFMVLHLAVLSFPHLFLIGLVLGYLRVRTGSLYPGMLAHFTHNLLVVLAELWQEGGPGAG